MSKTLWDSWIPSIPARVNLLGSQHSLINTVHPTAQIGPHVTMGKYNEIGERVIVDGDVTLGDCCRIEADTRIIAGSKRIVIGDWAVIHNHCFIGPGDVEIGHNLWLGQMVWLDGTGGLQLGHGVRIGTGSHVWTHAATAEQFEGGLYHLAPTVLENDVWLVGDTVTVNPGVHMAHRSIALAHSVITGDTQPERTYAGTPAREIDVPFWHKVSRDEQWDMVLDWVAEFSAKNGAMVDASKNGFVTLERDGDVLLVGFEPPNSKGATVFDLSTKRYTKRLTQLEREFYRFIYGNKARFIPEATA